MHRSALLNQNFYHRSTKRYSLQNSSFRLKSQLYIDATLPKVYKNLPELISQQCQGCILKGRVHIRLIQSN